MTIEITPHIVTPPKTCGNCGMELPPGGMHLSLMVCIKDLKDALGQFAALLGQEQQRSQQAVRTGRLAWILINQLPTKSQLFTKDELAMPAGASLHAEVKGDGLLATAIVRTPAGTKQ